MVHLLRRVIRRHRTEPAAKSEYAGINGEPCWIYAGAIRGGQIVPIGLAFAHKSGRMYGICRPRELHYKMINDRSRACSWDRLLNRFYELARRTRQQGSQARELSIGTRPLHIKNGLSSKLLQGRAALRNRLVKASRCTAHCEIFQSESCVLSRIFMENSRHMYTPAVLFWRSTSGLLRCAV